MTKEEYNHLLNIGSAGLNINVFCSDTDMDKLEKMCVYGSKYNRGVSESLSDYCQDVDHPVKESILCRELSYAGIASQVYPAA